MIETNCELPLCMLDENKELNSYDFVLFHLYISNKKYREYYMKSMFCSDRASYNRKMILDNSAYEFFIKGETLDLDKYVKVIQELQPNYYILPDVLMDKEKTLNNTKEFINRYNGVLNCFGGESIPIAVLQGNTSDEMFECLEQYLKWGLDYIAIPFHNSFFKDIMVTDKLKLTFADAYKITDINKLTDDHKYAMGRVRWMTYNIDKMKSMGVKYIHMLGSHCPLEKQYYNHMDIQTMDTAYPVKCALSGYELFKEPNKPNIILDDFLDKELYSFEKDMIRNNINIFKRL